MFATLLCALVATFVPIEAPQQLGPPLPAQQVLAQPLPALSALGPLPPGQTALTVEAGKPFYSLHLDRGLGSRVDAGLGIDLSAAGFLRPQLRARVRLFELGDTRLVLRGVLAVVVPDSRAGYGPRKVVRTEDGQAALAFEWAMVQQLALFAEGSILGETDFTSEHSASQLQGVVGVALGLLGPFAIIGQGGIIRGLRGHAPVGLGGLVFRF